MAAYRTGRRISNDREISLSDALTEGERRVLDLWDQARPIPAIAAELGIEQDFVERVVSYYDDCRSAEIDWKARAVAGCAAMLAAIQATGRAYA